MSKVSRKGEREMKLNKDYKSIPLQEEFEDEREYEELKKGDEK